MRNKKSQSISINTIIVAAIALIVLVVMILIFTGKIRLFGESVDSCSQKSGNCLTPDADSGNCPLNDAKEEVYATFKKTDCDKDNQNKVCCVRVLN